MTLNSAAFTEEGYHELRCANDAGLGYAIGMVMKHDKHKATVPLVHSTHSVLIEMVYTAMDEYMKRYPDDCPIESINMIHTAQLIENSDDVNAKTRAEILAEMNRDE